MPSGRSSSTVEPPVGALPHQSQLAVGADVLAEAMARLETSRSKLVCLQLAMTASATPAELTERLSLPLTSVLPVLGRLQELGIVERTDDGFALDCDRLAGR